ncbi:ATP-binding cassette sub-family G member 4 isoform X2 [Scaptodrosophila lebanonensis]|uniref:ATP-binding cassette sub-family G member 4 isoform X2 n=1 Tax=Drosophila lebanonensis TaxID=7225 RepID=A0A6J2U867_DROLE|nr:ATP-binding cassette sub-family G member 4 isoform X2 [Scaptodrosophila lebanonensis]
MTDSAGQRQTSNGLAIVQIPVVRLTPPRQELELHFSQVSYSVKSATKGTKQLLHEVCGQLRSGRLTGVLGPSGAGKTTLLNVLAGFKVNGVSGQFDLNGQPRDLLSFRNMSSYIPQDFEMLSLLTVEETLRVSADLKLPTSTPLEQKQKIIDDIVDILNLQSCRRTLVRSTSGGERKRLSMGIELITNPPVMFFDEPTSGLDSVTSLQVMGYLQRLAHDGRIVVCVVHQPSSNLMRLFDDVLVLAHGELLYAGPQAEMLGCFQQAGYCCPNYYNPADFVLEVGSESSNQRCDALIEQNKDRHSSIKRLHKLIPDEQTLMDSAIDLRPDSVVRPKEQVSFSYQLCVLMKRHLRVMSRNLIAVQMRIIMHVVVALLLGVVYWQIGDDAAKLPSNVACLFFVMLFAFSGNAMPSILLCLQESAIFIREYYNGWYSLNAYYISKVLADLPLQFTCPTLFIGISYFMTGQPPELSRFLMCWAVCIITTFIGHFIGVIAGSLLDMQMSIFIVPASTIPLMLFSGFFIRMRELSWFLRPICDISFFRYIFEGLMRAIYGYDRGHLSCQSEYCHFKSGKQFLKDIDMQGDEFGWDMMVLSLVTLLLLIAFYATLHVSIRRAL